MNQNIFKYQTNSRVGAIRPKVKSLGTFTEELLSEVLLHKIKFVFNLKQILLKRNVYFNCFNS